MANNDTKKRSGGRGFRGMSVKKRREIAAKGGRAAHAKGTAHQWSSEEARTAGRLGGRSRAKKAQQSE